MTRDALRRELIEPLVERFHPRRIILFGSHARGEAGEESDLDLFIELDTDLGKGPLDRAVAVREVFGLHPWPMDLLVFTTDEVEEMRRYRGTILDVVEAEGEVVYERP